MELITLGAQVIVYSSRDTIDSIIITLGAQVHCRFGLFKHDAMIGTPFGSKVPLPPLLECAS